MDYEKTKVAFYIERKSHRGMSGQMMPREVTAVFVDSGNYLMKDCYAHEGQHNTCAVDWVADSCRAATYDEYKPLMDELQNQVGYDLEVVEGAWWLEQAMRAVRRVRDYYKNGKAA